MVNLKDLKENLINNKPNKFYVFYGEDYGLRRHYINKIAESYSKRRCVDTTSDIEAAGRGRGLIKTSNLFIIYNDIDFARSRKNDIQEFIKGIDGSTTCIILVYEEALESSTLFKQFSDYITYFPRVKNEIAVEFVDSEVTLSTESKIELAQNCKNDYSNICLECDKIKNYAEHQGVSLQIAYEDLKNDKQLLYEYPPYNPDDLMDDILQGNFKNLGYWDEVINKLYAEEFWIKFSSIFNNYLIAYLITKYGKWNGGQRAFDYGLPWYRIKIVREYNIPYEPEYLLQCARNVCEIDAMVKNGKLTNEQLFDYFLTVVV